MNTKAFVAKKCIDHSLVIFFRMIYIRWFFFVAKDSHLPVASGATAAPINWNVFLYLRDGKEMVQRNLRNSYSDVVTKRRNSSAATFIFWVVVLYQHDYDSLECECTRQIYILKRRPSCYWANKSEINLHYSVNLFYNTCTKCILICV